MNSHQISWKWDILNILCWTQNILRKWFYSVFQIKPHSVKWMILLEQPWNSYGAYGVIYMIDCIFWLWDLEGSTTPALCLFCTRETCSLASWKTAETCQKREHFCSVIYFQPTSKSNWMQITCTLIWTVSLAIFAARRIFTKRKQCLACI